MKKAAAVLAAVFIGAACAPVGSSAPPELLVPVSVQEDTARVTRGNVEVAEQYRGMVRMVSEKLYFGDTGLRFGEYFCVPGQEVRKGELLARLDTEYLDEEIQTQREAIAHLRRESAFENESLELDITIAQVEQQAYTQNLTDISEDALIMAENARAVVEEKRLALSQAQERQSLSLTYAQDYLRELEERAAGAEMYAPFDGVITYVEDKVPGAQVEPYAPLIYISDGRELFVEYTSIVTLSVSRNAVAVGFIGDRAYDLERIPLSAQDMIYYNNQRLSPPVRFNFLDPDEDVTPGAYVAIRIYSSVSEDVLRIPVNAYYSDAELGAYVYVREDGQKVMRSVTTGLRSEVYVEVKQGLEEGEEVYVK